MIKKLIAAGLAVSATAAFGASVPAPSFNDFPELYSERPVASGKQLPQPRTAPAGRFTGGGHPDPMHDSY